MTDGWFASDDSGASGGLVPFYVLVDGRTSPRNKDLELNLATQVFALKTDTSRLDPEYHRIVQMCAQPMSVAELGSYLKIPLALTKLLVDELVDKKYLGLGVAAQHAPKHAVLEQLIAGLNRL